MEKGQRTNRKLPTITIIIALILVITAFANIYFLLNNKYDTNDIENKIKLNEEKLSNLTKQEEKLDEEIISYEDIDKQINDTKNTYFSSIKTLEDLIISGNSNKKIAYLTFDDGPYYSTYEFLDVLDRYDVKATFFVQGTNGQYCYMHKDQDCYLLYKEYVKRGHTIANHTYHHLVGDRYVYQSSDNFIRSIEIQEKIINEQTGGYKTNIVRFPGGSATAKGLKNEIIEKLREKGYGWVDWTANDGDGGRLYSDEHAWNNFISTIDQNIEVVLFHDYNYYTLSILPRVIEYLRENGYILLPLFYESNMVNK